MRKLKLLMLEDDPDFARDFQTYLQSDGAPGEINVDLAHEVSDALTFIESIPRNQPYDLICVDLKLGSPASGIDFLEELRTRTLHLLTPIVVLTDLSADSISIGKRWYDIEYLYDLGMDHYFEKFDIFDFSVREFLDSVLQGRALPQYSDPYLRTELIEESLFNVSGVTLAVSLAGWLCSVVLKSDISAIIAASSMTVSSTVIATLVLKKIPKRVSNPA